MQFPSPYEFMNNFSYSMAAIGPPWSEMTAYDLNTGDIKWRVPTGVVLAPPEMNIPANTGSHFPRSGPLVTAGASCSLRPEPIGDSAPTTVTTEKRCGRSSFPRRRKGCRRPMRSTGGSSSSCPSHRAPASLPRASVAHAAGGRGPAPGAAPAAPAPGRGGAAPPAAPAAGAPPEAAAARQGGGGRGGGRGGAGGGPPGQYMVLALRR